MSWPTSDRDVYLVLLAALIFSLLLGAVSTGPLAVTIIFIVATYKAWLVLTRFIGMSVDPHYVKMTVVTVLTILAILYIALVPDIVWVFGGDVPS